MSFITWTPEAGLGACGTRLRFLCENALGLSVIDDSHRIAALALRRAVDTHREVGFMLRAVGGLGYFRLTGEITGEAIFPAGELNPFLREQRPRNRKRQR